MDIFSWLVVGHLIGDWFCQNDWMARNKQRRFLNVAILTHSLIYTVAIMVGIWLGAPGQGAATLIWIAVYIFVSHWIIDAGKVAIYWGELIGQSEQMFVRIMADQTLHIIILATLPSMLG